MKQKGIEIPIHEALDNLSVIAELDDEGFDDIGIVEDNKFVSDDDEFRSNSIDWISSENTEEIVDKMKKTFHSILSYFEDIYEEEMTDWEDIGTKRGIQSIMVLVGEGANKLNRYLALYKDVPESHDITDCKEYRQLQEFYRQKLMEKFPKKLEGDNSWQEEWRSNNQSLVLDLDKRGLKDFETIRKDQEYELFYLRDDEEKPFFNRELIRNIKLFCDFDESMEIDLLEDPLIDIHALQDKDLQISAKQILDQLNPLIKKLFREKEQLKNYSLPTYLYQAFLALMLAANPNNLIENTIGKSSFQYFEDFQYFLRQSLSCDEFQHLLAYGSDKDNNQYSFLLDIIWQLCSSFFCHLGGIKEEMIGYIYRLIRKGVEKKKDTIDKKDSFWIRLLQEDDAIRSLLKLYPNGPIFKDLDILRLEEEINISFEPILQGNIPFEQFHLNFDQHKLKVIHLPCPTSQHLISKVKINLEFEGFLRFLSLNGKKHLLINLQDRTSWKEYARSSALEKMMLEAEFKRSLCAITLSKDAPFYYQQEEYFVMNKSKDFIHHLTHEVLNLKDGGYFFSNEIKAKYLDRFVIDAIECIHKCFFSGKEVLTLKNRLDFIETLYQFIVIKVLLEEKVTSISFTCKDGLDKGAVETGGLFSFLHLLKGEKLSKENERYMVWLLYAPALIVRERAVDSQRLNRIVSFLSYIENEVDKNYKQIKSEVDKLFGKSFLKNMEIS